MTEELITRTENTSLCNTALNLPKYDKLSEASVVKQMQAVFKGFQYDKDFNPTDVFKTVDQVGEYASEAVRELDEADNKFKIGAILNQGAIAAKRWHFGFMIAKCLDTASYGSDVAAKIAAKANISQTYIYQYRAVGEHLTLKDAYVLGMYGAGWDVIRKLAALGDDDVRKNMIKWFVDSITDYNNVLVREEARSALVSAIENYKKAPETMSVSAPAELEAVANFDKEAPEFIECRKQVDVLKSAMRGLTKDKKIEAFLNAASSCYLPDTVIGAEEHLETFHGSCTEALNLLQRVENLIPQLREQLQSLENMPLEKTSES